MFTKFPVLVLICVHNVLAPLNFHSYASFHEIKISVDERIFI